MLFTAIAQDYFRWHYTRALREIFHVWLNFLWFITNFFSIPQLTKSWFAPWKRMTENRGSTFNFEDLAGFIIINLISRIIGALCRTVIIGIGLIALTITICMGFITYLFWLAAPVVIIALMAFGITLFVTNIIV